MRCVFTIVIRTGPQFKWVLLYSEILPLWSNEVIRNSFIRLSVLLVTSFINAAVRRFCTLSIYVIPPSCNFYKVRTIKCIMLIPITKWTSWFWKTWMKHMEGLFQRFSKLLPFRIDFAYRKDTPSFGHSCKHSMCIEMHRLLSETQTMLAGYYWVMEYTPDKGVMTPTYW